MEQLKLTEKELWEIGFTVNTVNGEAVYEIPFINGCFYYNHNQSIYKWYHKTIIGKRSNHIHLDITNKPSLFMMLSCFRVKFNLVIS